MRKKAGSIPVNKFGDETGAGISIERIVFEQLPPLGEWEQPERHDRHSFFLLENGSVTMEIDFQTYEIRSPSVIYMHPDRVHRIVAFNNVTVSAWAVENQNLNPEYLKLLEEISLLAPVPLDDAAFTLICEAASLCIRLTGRKKDQLYYSMLKDQGNALVALVISAYLEGRETTDKLSRAELITQSFRAMLALHFIQLKRPAEYAEKLNLSVAYLNECVKNTTGHPVSWHIQQRVILEAMRLLHHANHSLKEIAAALGYDDYPYFSRLFTKVTGKSPAAFRLKNHD